MRIRSPSAFLVACLVSLCVSEVGAVVLAADEDVPALVAQLHQTRASTPDQLRAVLKSIHADVPNAKGTFETPGRDDRPKGELDWLAALGALPAAPARDDAMATVTALRTLAAAKTDAAAEAVLDFGFTPEGLVYRDECGRQLRTMSPYSLASLLRASQDRKRDGGNYARYANYQLDRLSMNRPSYALAAAPNDTVEVAMLKAIGDVKHPDAVTAVLDRVDAPAHAVRNAARAAWLAYVTGPEPPPAPMEFRKLAGGKKSKDKMPLYLTYRELAEQELRRVLFGLQGSEPAKNMTAEQMTKVLFDLYDRRHAEKGDEVVRDALPLAREGKWDDVAVRYDALLHDDPLFAHRATMVPGYLEIGAWYAKQKKWDKAILAYDTALTLDPDGEHAKDATAGLAASRSARQGGGAGAEARAAAAPTEDTATNSSGQLGQMGKKGWLLYVGLTGGIIGALLVLYAAVLRRRRAHA